MINKNSNPISQTSSVYVLFTIGKCFFGFLQITFNICRALKLESTALPKNYKAHDIELRCRAAHKKEIGKNCNILFRLLY